MIIEYDIIDEIKWSNGFYNEFYLVIKSISINNIIIQYQISFYSKGFKIYCDYCKKNNDCNCKSNTETNGIVNNDILLKCDYFNNAINIYNKLKDNINDIKYLSKKDLWIWMKPIIQKEYNL